MMSQVRNLKIFSSSLGESSQLLSGFGGSKVPSSVLRRLSSMGRIGSRRPMKDDDHGVDDFSPKKPDLDVPEPIPGRPLRNERPFPRQSQHLQQNNQRMSRRDDTNPHRHRSGKDHVSGKFNKMRDFDFGGDGDGEKENKFSESSAPEFLRKERKREDSSENSFLDKFKLGFAEEKSGKNENVQLVEEKLKGINQPEPPPEASVIFKKMKETGLIPNAVAMLDGLCKDGLVQEAMKLFGLMREKGTIPEVVIYTAVVEGFCKANKPDDAKRIFKKMQANGIAPNAFSYSVLVQGLCKCGKLEDGIGFCEEMLEAGHSPNVMTFVGLVDGVCREKGVEEARRFIGTLKQKGFFLDERAVREYLDRRGLFNSKVWEAIFGLTTSKRPF